MKDKTVFSELEKFDIIENAVVDFMHDIAEGTSNYDLCQIITAFMNKNYFSLEYLNNVMRNFKYPSEVKNHPGNITKENLKNMSFKFSAAEAVAFIEHFNLMISEKIPENDDHWKLYMLLRKILAIVQSTSVFNHSHKILAQLVSEHNELYVKLFHGTLKYKTHLLLHYPSIMEKFGPLTQFSNFRFESKHSESVKTIEVSNNKVNLPKTLAIKSQFHLANFLLNYNFVNDHSPFDHRLLNDYNLLFSSELFNSDNILRHKALTTQGKVLRMSTVIELKSEIEFLFVEVVLILEKEKEIFILNKRLI